MVRALNNATDVVTLGFAALNETLGGIMSLTGDEPKYVPLEQFMEAEAMKAANGDFDLSDLIFEDEFRGGVK